MYSIPNDFKQEQLENATIEQIAFTANNISISLGLSRSITIEGAFVLEPIGEGKKIFEVCPVTQDFGLLALLEKRIVTAEINREVNSLIFLMENGTRLEILSSEFYESFTVRIGDFILIV